MAALLFREQFDEMARHGCIMPGCKHEEHEPVVFINSRCHVGAQAEASYQEENCLRLYCGKCNRFIADVAIKAAKGFKRCHVNAPLQISYREGTGVLKIECRECQALLTELEVEATS